MTRTLSGQDPFERVWKPAEEAVVNGDVAALDTLLRDHTDLLRRGPVQSTWWSGLAPSYAGGDARAIIAREHHFENWDQFAAYAEALKDRHSSIAQFEAAVDAVVSGDVATLERLLQANPALARARSTRAHHSTLLHYVGAKKRFRDADSVLRSPLPESLNTIRYEHPSGDCRCGGGIDGLPARSRCVGGRSERSNGVVQPD
jgi:hypothetical protein